MASFLIFPASITFPLKEPIDKEPSITPLLALIIPLICAAAPVIVPADVKSPDCIS